MPPGDAGWAPVVYARTPRSDAWWRAVPQGVDTAGPGWLPHGVHAVVQGGQDLRLAPRYVLARRGDATLVGVACRAAHLSSTRSSDGTRDLYCFVGWLGSGPVPALPELEARHVDWAAPAYEYWVGRDWDLGQSEDRAPHITETGFSPWSASDVVAGEPAPLVEVSGTEVWPRSAAAELWASAALTRADLLVVVGARTARPDRLRGVTHVAAADAASRHVLNTLPRVAAPSPPSPPPPVTASPPSGPLRGLLRWWRPRR